MHVYADLVNIVLNVLFAIFRAAEKEDSQHIIVNNGKSSQNCVLLLLSFFLYYQRIYGETVACPAKGLVRRTCGRLTGQSSETDCIYCELYHSTTTTWHACTFLHQNTDLM